ncbi:MAG: hypothetical protein ACE5I4_01035 [Thermoplasmata archaeon]
MATERVDLEFEERLRRSFAPALPYAPYDAYDLIDTFPASEELIGRFHEIWGRIEDHLDVSLTSEEALKHFPSLLLYDIPDGTRSTLTVRPDVDVGMDAGLYCLALIHTLRGLGGRRAAIMSHTSYNRSRGEEGLDRIFAVIAKSTRVAARYAAAHHVNIRWVGMKPDYELSNALRENFPLQEKASFDAFLLIDYVEEILEQEGLREQLEDLPDVDVCIRHTKLNLSGGGWIPGKMLRSAFLYSQNGTIFSNWTFDELVAQAAIALLAKLFNTGEGLVKMYGDLDEVKARYQLRELRLFNRQVLLRSQPRKLFVFGSPVGLYQVYY